MMSAADYEVMARYALEDAGRTSNPMLKALYEEHSRQWLALAASHRSNAAARPPVRLLVSDEIPEREPEGRPSRAAA